LFFFEFVVVKSILYHLVNRETKVYGFFIQYMASSAGQRKTNPPERLIDQLQPGVPIKNIPIMPNQEPNKSVSETNKEVTLVDLMVMMKQSQEVRNS